MTKTKSAEGGVERSALHRLRSLDNPEEPDFFQQLVLLFLQELEKWQPILSHAVERQDWVQVVKAAHEIGGTGMQCGANKLAGLCRRVQSMDPGDFTGARAVISEVLAEIELVRTTLTSEVTHK
jgi:HPt (histidine-containing phosphotransfer) domain-containing protein